MNSSQPQPLPAQLQSVRSAKILDKPLASALRRGLTAATIAASMTAASVAPPAAVLAQEATAAQSTASSRQAAGPLQLKVRRLPDAVELVIQGTGAGPQLQQATSGNGWQGQLRTAEATGLKTGPQRLALPEVGLQSISFDGSGDSYALSVTPTPGINLSRPLVSADGRDLIVTFPSPVPQANLQTNSLNLAQPGAVPAPSYAPPLQPRAVAPALGDMAVGTMTLRNPGYVNLSGPPVTMTLKNAPAKDVLMALSQLGGYGFAYVQGEDGGDAGERPISVSFRAESYGRAFNTALLAGGLAGKKEGNTVFAGPNVLSKSFGPQVSKVYRLNQVGPEGAADYLANLGASVTKTNTVTTSVSQGISNNEAISGTATGQTTQSTSITEVEVYGASSGPLVGLRATTDARLRQITMVGAPEVVAIAEQYLKQLDLRQRQVALNVKILDINLTNVSEIDNSFAFRFGNNFIVNNSGELLGSFGRNLPPNETSFNRNVDFDSAFDQGAATAERVRLRTDGVDTTLQNSAFRKRPNPGQFYAEDAFYDFVRAQITSGTTKVLASPTLVLSENPASLGAGVTADGQDLGGRNSGIGRAKANEALVRVGTDLVTTYDIKQDLNGNAFCEAEFETAGLVLGARIEKIDDNGFVTFSMSPQISAATDQQLVPNCGPINILSSRSLDTGAVRVRDGQTLILTGVISEQDFEIVNKWPILGDLPLVGQFFRSTTSDKEKRELVIMVTPRIINDDQGGDYGYGYRPGTRSVREILGAQG